MYEFILELHNIFRWIVLLLALIAVITAFIGGIGKREWTKRVQTNRHLLYHLDGYSAFARVNPIPVFQ